MPHIYPSNDCLILESKCCFRSKEEVSFLKISVFVRDRHTELLSARSLPKFPQQMGLGGTKSRSVMWVTGKQLSHHHYHLVSTLTGNWSQELKPMIKLWFSNVRHRCVNQHHSSQAKCFLQNRSFEKTCFILEWSWLPPSNHYIIRNQQ